MSAHRWPREVEVEAEITYCTTFKARLIVEETDMAEPEKVKRRFLQAMWDGDLHQEDTVLHSEEVTAVYRTDARCKVRDPKAATPWCRIHDDPMTHDDPSTCYTKRNMEPAWQPRAVAS